MSDSVWLGLISIALALVACIVPTVTVLSARREAREARREAQEARFEQNRKLDKQDEVLATVATKDAVDEVHAVVNSKHEAALASIEALKAEVLRLNQTGEVTPTVETPATVTIAGGVVKVQPNGQAVEVVDIMQSAAPDSMNE